jgi:nitric-oxide synthase
MSASQAVAGCPFHHEDESEVLPAASPGTDEVREFFELYRENTGMTAEAWRRRLDAVETEIAVRGTYTHTTDEVTVGAKLAWRNHTRCIGKLYWRSLVVRDCRKQTSAAAIRDACFDHLKFAANGGRVRPVISIFAPDEPLRPAARVRNAQLVAYAGHRLPDGSIVGDAARVELTKLANHCGWNPGTPSPFDVLPLVIETPEEGLTAHRLPPELAHEVAIHHPTIPGLSKLGLRWYGFPTVSDMALSVGGVTYPLAPFTGWYLAPEVSARDFSDTYRYNLLPEIAEALGLDTSDRRSLWQDRALIELTTAILSSYDRAGLRIDDHHSASEKFHRYTQSERRKGRDVDADWNWIVPPISGSATPVFHETYRNTEQLPNFIRI